MVAVVYLLFLVAIPFCMARYCPRTSSFWKRNRPSSFHTVIVSQVLAIDYISFINLTGEILTMVEIITGLPPSYVTRN